MTKFAVVDLETTGGHAASNRIIEVGIVIVENGVFIEEYQSYVNPETSIPRYITSLTGIEDEDVVDAPTFQEIAKDIRGLLDGRIFVAQNVNFDYSFLKKEYELIGEAFQYKRLCTSRYARSSINGLRRSGLKHLANYFDINNDQPHRALSDAKTAAFILLELMKRDLDLEVAQRLVNIQKTKVTLPLNVPPEDYKDLPSKPGVYFFTGEDGKPLYIGKAKNVKQRVSSHFNGDLKSEKLQGFIREIHRIEFEETGSDILAYLFEDMMIRKHWPPYNKAQKNPTRKFGVHSYQDQQRNWRLAVNPIKQTNGSLRWFHYYSSAMHWVHDMTVKYDLNPLYTGILSLEGVVLGDQHNDQFSEFINSDEFIDETRFWRENGRNSEEDCILVSEGNRVKGYLFIDKDNRNLSKEQLLNSMELLTSSGTTEKILENYFNKKKPKLLSW